MEVEQAITRIITREPRRIPREYQGYYSGHEPLVTVFPGVPGLGTPRGGPGASGPAMSTTGGPWVGWA